MSRFSIEFQRSLSQFVRDMGYTPARALGVLLGIGTGLWMNVFYSEWTSQLAATVMALELVFTVCSIRAVIWQILRHRRFNARWKALQADVDMAIQLEDFAWAENCLAEMRALYRDEFGRDMFARRMT
jgi:hypothetical protein